MIPALIAGGIAAASLIGNMYNSNQDRKSRERAASRLSEQQRATDNEYSQMLRDIDSYYNGRGSLGTAQDVTSYKDAIAGYDPNKFVYDRGEFDYGKTADDFITPLRDKIVANEIAGVQHSAAGAGLGRGSGAAEAIAQAVADKDEELYRLAQEDYRDDRDFAYKKYSDYAQAMQNKLDTLRAATDTKLTMQGNLANDYYATMDAAQADRLKARQDKLATDATYAQAMAGLV
jgi:hypothetical protein